jgi:hypothetical protein
MPASVVKETIALLKTGSASYFTEKTVTRTAVGIADWRTQTQYQADPPGDKW